MNWLACAIVTLGLLIPPPDGKSVASDQPAEPASRPTPVTAGLGRPLSSLVDVAIRCDQPRVAVNSPVEVEFVVRNKTADFVQVEVPLGDLAGRLPEGFAISGMGLPIEHVFSGEKFRGLGVAIEGDPYVGDRVAMTPSRSVPPIVLAPFGQVGIKFDITRYYPMMRREGRYELRWKPYGGQVSAQPILVEVRAYKQVVLETDVGRLTLRLFYDKAPKTVDNFLELVDQRFYDGLKFFLVNPAMAVQAGCPRGDASSLRPDGKTIPPEFNDIEFDVGTVGMALTRLSPSQVDPNSGSCQFFICLARQPVFDGRYTAFAQVEGPDSMETLKKIAATPRGPNGYPIKPVVIKNATTQNAPQPPPR